MSLPSAIDTVVIGAGQAGLTMSWYLAAGGREHVVLDRRSRAGGGWQDRWDAFRLVTPNWSAAFPGDPYDGTDPDGFMPRDEVVARVAGFADARERRSRWERRSDASPRTMAAGRSRRMTGRSVPSNVVVATGGFHRPMVPPLAAELPGA